MTSGEKTIVAALLAIAVCWPSGARAQSSAQDIETARQLYNDGLQLRESGDMEGALEKFRAAHALGNTPLTGLELCRAHAALRQPVEAREACLAVGRIAPARQETSRSKDARREAARLAEAERAKIGSLRVTLTGIPAGFQPTVTIDGAVVPPEALNEPRAMNPGVHEITARIGDGPEASATIEMAEADEREIEIAVEAPAESAEAPLSERTSGGAAPLKPKKNHSVAIAGFTVAGVAAAAGALAGLVAAGGKADLDLKCVDTVCGPEHADALQSARQWGDASTGLFVVAGIGLTTGVVAMIVTSSRAPARPAAATRSPVRVAPVLGLGGAGVHGSF